jgi:hypothetical protein
VIDRDVRRRHHDCLCVRQRVKSVLSVGVAHARCANASERHRFDKDVDVGLVDGPTTEREAGYEPVNRALVLAEDEAGKRPGATLDRR